MDNAAPFIVLAIVLVITGVLLMYRMRDKKLNEFAKSWALTFVWNLKRRCTSPKKCHSAVFLLWNRTHSVNIPIKKIILLV